jgi:hypothetical protein
MLNPDRHLLLLEWHLPAFADCWLPPRQLDQIKIWASRNAVDLFTTASPIDVTEGTITYGSSKSSRWLLPADRDIETRTATLRTPPPDVWQIDCSPQQLTALQAVLANHPPLYGTGSHCAGCCGPERDALGRIQSSTIKNPVEWPCAPARAALAKARVPVPSRIEPLPPFRAQNGNPFEMPAPIPRPTRN